MKSWSKIWIEISEAFDIYPKNRTPRQAEMTRWGLCYGLLQCNVYTRFINQFMSMGIKFKTPASCEPYWWKIRTPESDSHRAIFAGLMAAMGDEGFADFLKWCEEHLG